MISARFVFHFFEIMIFRTVKGLKGQKIVQNKKKQLHLSRIISQEQLRI